MVCKSINYTSYIYASPKKERKLCTPLLPPIFFNLDEQQQPPPRLNIQRLSIKLSFYDLVYKHIFMFKFDLFNGMAYT